MKCTLTSAARITQATTIILVGVGLFSGCAAGQTPNQPAVQTQPPPPYVRSATCLALDARKANQEAEALQLDANSKQLMDDSFTMTDQTQASTARIQADTMRLQALNLRTDHEAELSAQCLMESDTR